MDKLGKNKPKKSAKKVDKSKADNSKKEQSMDTTLGDELLEREFKRSQDVRDLLSKHKFQEED